MYRMSWRRASAQQVPLNVHVVMVPIPVVVMVLSSPRVILTGLGRRVKLVNHSWQGLIVQC